MIVLTGATGFLGSALLEKLLARGDKVIAIKRSTSNVDKIKVLLDHPNLRLLDIDIVDPACLFKSNKIDTIIHTATEYGRGTTPLFSILNANLLLPLRLAELGMQVECVVLLIRTLSLIRQVTRIRIC
jgi:nucleoside-diphosphate-sugar epimerase